MRINTKSDILAQAFIRHRVTVGHWPSTNAVFLGLDEVVLFQGHWCTHGAEMPLPI